MLEECKEWFIHQLSIKSDCYGYPYLVGVMEHYNAYNLRVLTLEQVRAYYNKYIGGKIMEHEIRFWRFADGSFYTTALEIENYGASFGASIRRDPNGTRHPGSVVNGHIKTIKKDQALRRKFNLSTSDCIQLDVNHPGNFTVINDMLSENIINHSALKGGCLDLYSRKTCDAVVCMMLKRIDFHSDNDDIISVESYAKVDIKPTVKRFDKVRDRVDKNHSLIARRNVQAISEMTENAMPSVLSMMSAEEQSIVRKYQTLVKTTRANGRPYIKKGGVK